MLDNRLKGINLYLIGMMGAGKTTVAQQVAQQLGYRFFDTDHVIEQAAKQTVSEIFASSGEATFRELETQVLAELSAYKRLAIATGGGIILQQRNWSYLRHGIVIWLDVPVERLYDRLKQDTTRPLLQDPDPQARLATLLQERQSLYAQADVRVAVAEQSPEELAIAVLQAIEGVLKPEPSAEVEWVRSAETAHNN